MRKIITSAVAASFLLGSAVSATAAPTFERAGASVEEAEGVEGSSLLIVLLIAAIGAGIVYFIEDNEDQDLPTSP